MNLSPERNDLSEPLTEKSLREKDMKEFWKGFTDFRTRNRKLETELRNKIGKASRSFMPITPTAPRLDRGTELLMIIAYGANLAKNLRPNLIKDVPVPEILIQNTTPAVGLLTRHNKDWEITGSNFVVNIGYILDPFGNTLHTLPWQFEDDKTVSGNFRDWFVIDSVLDGAEEYAHELFVRLKNSSKLKKFDKENLQILADYKILYNQYNEDEAEITYHTQSIERHALVWQQEILNKHFPHWSAPTREFISRVSELRIARQDKKKNDSV